MTAALPGLVTRVLGFGLNAPSCRISVGSLHRVDHGAAGIDVEGIAEFVRLRRRDCLDARGVVARVVAAEAALAERAEQIAQRAIAEKIQALVGHFEPRRRRVGTEAAAGAARLALRALGLQIGRRRDEAFLHHPLDDVLDQLLERLSVPVWRRMYGESDDDRTMQALHDAIMDALFNGGVLPEEALERLLGDPADADQADARSKLEQLIQDIIDRMMQEGFITPAPDLEPERAQRQSRGTGGGFGPDAPPTRFEVTDKSLDFLGYRALRDLLGSLGKSSLGRHDTRDNSTGIETIAAPKPYEFGDSPQSRSQQHRAECRAAHPYRMRREGAAT